ncbi:MAG: diguanylate cyclase [Syntrophomonadaceae bacterium]|nr:diguanylate cyclase [Syntrophomonadaceae bacterium]
MKIKDRLIFTHGILIILAILIVLTNVITFVSILNDAAIINQSGKLRALSYNMAVLANRLNNEESIHPNGWENIIKAKQLEFENIIYNLKNAEKANLPKIKDRPTLVRLESIEVNWLENIKPLYEDMLVGQSVKENTLQINQQIDAYVYDINDLVTCYSFYSKAKVIKALWINAILLLFIILLSLYSLRSSSRHISQPFHLLMQNINELSALEEDFANDMGRYKFDEISRINQQFNLLIYDQLTKTYNRRSGMAKLQNLFQASKTKDSLISFCFIDINGLKEVNDKLGHIIGDELIVTVVSVINSEIRAKDFIIRMGGDEFLIVFLGLGHFAAEQIWGRIVNKYETINQTEDRPYIISVSHGVIEHDNTMLNDIDELVRMADDIMYEEKKFIKGELQLKIIKA